MVASCTAYDEMDGFFAGTEGWARTSGWRFVSSRVGKNKQANLSSLDSCDTFASFLSRRGPYPWLSRDKVAVASDLAVRLRAGWSKTVCGKLLLAHMYRRSRLGNSRTEEVVSRWIADILHRASRKDLY